MSDGEYRPWWFDDPPWLCRRCGRSFGLVHAEVEHLEGRNLCGEWSHSCLCRSCSRLILLEDAMRKSGVEVEESTPGQHLIAEPGALLAVDDDGVEPA